MFHAKGNSTFRQEDERYTHEQPRSPPSGASMTVRLQAVTTLDPRYSPADNKVHGYERDKQVTQRSHGFRRKPGTVPISQAAWALRDLDRI